MNNIPEIQIIDNININEAKAFELDNGIKVFAIDAGSQDIMRTDFIFKASVWQQEKFFQASFTNSLLREGTKNYTASEISSKFDFMGTFFGSDIDKHAATISFYSLHKFYEQSLELVEDIIKNPIFTEHEFAIKKQQRIQKFKVAKQKVESLASDKYFELLFGTKHPYGKKSELEDFEKIAVSDLINFHKRFYHSDNVYILMAGKNPEKFIPMLNLKFGKTDWKATENVPDRHFAIEQAAAGEYLVKKDDAKQSAIRAGMILKPESTQDFFSLLMLNMIYGGYFGSRLMQNLREDKGYTYGISSVVREEKEATLFLIHTNVGVEYTKNSIQEIKKELEILVNEKIDEEELDMAKRQMLGDILTLFDGPFAQIDAFQYLYDLNKDYSYYLSLIKAIQEFTPEALLETAKKYLQSKNLRIAIAGNFVD
jgi:predicted Zn-dependent peptidase